MASVEMLMPKMGESIIEGTILSWLKSEGDEIEQDESVLEVATDKVDTEVPATHGGILKKILAKEGDVIAVGAPIAIIETSGEVESPAAEPSDTQKEELVAAAPDNTASILSEPEVSSVDVSSEDGRFLFPSGKEYCERRRHLSC